MIYIDVTIQQEPFDKAEYQNPSINLKTEGAISLQSERGRIFLSLLTVRPSNTGQPSLTQSSPGEQHNCQARLREL